MPYEALISQYPHIKIKEVTNLPRGLAGLYLDNEIRIDKYRSKYEKHGILAEEFGHYETSHGDIVDLSHIQNMKLEVIARRWGYKKIVPLDKLIECYIKDYTTLEEVCEHLEITSNYLQTSLNYYKDRHGLFVLRKNFKISFDPLNVERC
ncbi:ImmA/IrrE family metallo-endopeptidase [Psychrobacillus sp.]|uniref:ImmA/IrrE family metallo-endopeptidase n=1 Tax=Psychrobacillus sp. TaxID=1871623 RepID=UPI0028BD8E84|nr:ImmA/IrrE family metallo-endopeptidase [Psychrobacillus sp.]